MPDLDIFARTFGDKRALSRASDAHDCNEDIILPAQLNDETSSV